MTRSTLIGSTVLLAAVLTACTSSGSTPAKTSTTNGTTTASSTQAPPSATSPTPAAPAASAASAASAPAATAATITIKNFSYQVTGKVSPGQKIVVHNMDSAAHTVTADTGSAFDVMAPAGAMTMLTAPAKAGSYKFHCNYHSNMHGTLKVG